MNHVLSVWESESVSERESYALIRDVWLVAIDTLIRLPHIFAPYLNVCVCKLLLHTYTAKVK